MKVYVITVGEYSDYRICAVTLDKEKAEKLKEKCDHFNYTGASIDEYDTDECESIIVDSVYKVDFNKSGDCIYAKTRELNSYTMEMLNEKPWVRSGILTVYVMADNKEAAIKIGAEKRAKYLAEQMGL